MATIHEIAYRMEMRARRQRQSWIVYTNDNPASVAGRTTIPDWYIREMVDVSGSADGHRRGVRP